MDTDPFGNRQRVLIVLLLSSLSVLVYGDEISDAAERRKDARAQQLASQSSILEELQIASQENQNALDELFAPLSRIERGRIERMVEKYRQNRAVLLDADAALVDLRKNREALSAERTLTVAEIAKLESQIDVLRTEIGKAKDPAEIDAALESAQSAIESLQDMQGDLERSRLEERMLVSRINSETDRLKVLQDQQALIESNCQVFIERADAQEAFELSLRRAEAEQLILSRMSASYGKHVARLDRVEKLPKDEVAMLVEQELDNTDEITDAIDRNKKAGAQRLEDHRQAEAERLQKEAEAQRIALIAKKRNDELLRRDHTLSVESAARAQVQEVMKDIAKRAEIVSELEISVAVNEGSGQKDRLAENTAFLAAERAAMAESQQLLEAAYAELRNSRVDANETRSLIRSEYMADLKRSRDSRWQVGAGVSFRNFDKLDFASQNFQGSGGHRTGTFIENNDLPTASNTVQAALANGPYGVQGLTSDSVNQAYAPTFVRSLFEDQSYIDATPAQNVTLAADYASFNGSRDGLDDSSDFAPHLSISRKLARRGKWSLSVAGQVEYHQLKMDASYSGDSISTGKFTTEQYRHALVDVDDNTAIGFQDFLLAVNPYDPARTGLGNGVPTENNTSFSMRNGFDADLFMLELGLKASYRGDKLAWNFGLGTSVAYADATSKQDWRASWASYTSNTPTVGLYPSAPFVIPAGSSSDSVTHSSTDTLFGGYASFGGQYYLNPFLSIGADLRYDFFSDRIKTQSAELELDSMSLNLGVYYDF